MIDLHTYLLFIGTVILLMIVPGPDMVYILGRTITQSRRAGVIASVGVNVGAYVHVTAAILGLSAILATSSTVFTIVKLAGACYLIWLGIQTIRKQSAALDFNSAATNQLSYTIIFWQGFLCDTLNPKVALFFLAFFPQFININSTNLVQQMIILGVTCNVIALWINLLFVCFASIATSKLKSDQAVMAWLNKITGMLFISLGIRLAIEKLNSH